MTEENQKILNQYYEALDLATILYNDIWEDAMMWMQTPTDLLFGVSPAEAIVGGDGDKVIDWLKERSRKNDPTV